MYSTLALGKEREIVKEETALRKEYAHVHEVQLFLKLSQGLCCVVLLCLSFYLSVWSIHVRVPISLQDLVGRLSLQEMVSQMSHGGAENNGQLLKLYFIVTTHFYYYLDVA